MAISQSATAFAHAQKARSSQRYATNSFERFINSTFGGPQQIFMRLLRVAQDPNVDLFSEEGILDQALVPILGLWDEDRHDVSMPEMVERTNKLLGTSMDPDSFWAQLGVGIGTDPLTYLGGGATALGRGGRALQKAAKTNAGRKALSKLGPNPALPAVREALEGALQGRVPRAARKKLNRAVKELGDEGALGSHIGPMGLDDAVKLSRDRELRLSAPFFNMAGKALYRTQDHSNWISLIGNKTRASAAVTAMGKGLSKIPVVSNAVDNLSAISKGAKASGMSSLAVAGERLAAKTEDLLDKELSPTGIAMYRRLTDKLDPHSVAARYRKALDRGIDPDRALVRIVLGKRPRSAEEMETMATDAKRILGIDKADDLADVDLQDLIARHEAGVASLQGQAVSVSATTKAAELRGEFGHLSGFKFGEKMADMRRKIFSSEAHMESLVAGDKKARQLVARATESIEGVGKLLQETAVADAKLMTMSAEDFEAFMLMRSQVDVLADELMETSRLVGLDDNVTGFAQARTNLGLRMVNMAERLVMFADSRPDLQALAKPYKELAKSLGDGTRLTAKYEELAKVRVVGEPPKLGGAAQNQHVVRVGSKGKAVHLGNLSDSQLQTVLRRLKKQSSRPMTKTEVGQAIRKDEVLDRMRRKYGLTTDDMMHNLRRARKAGGIKMLTRAPKRAPLAKPFDKPPRIRIPAEELEHFHDVAKLSDTKFVVEDMKSLSVAERTDVHQIESLLELRAAGKEAKMPRAHPSIETLITDPRKPLDIFQETVTPHGPIAEGLEGTAGAIARLLHGADELKRTKLVTPALLEDLEQAAIEASRQFLKPIDDMLDAAGATNYRGMVDKYRRTILNEAVEHKLISSSSPIAYVGRIISREGVKAIAAGLGRDEVRKVLQSAMPQLSSGFARNLDALPIEDLNNLYHVLQTSGNADAEKLAKTIAKAAEKEGLRMGKFEISPSNIITSRLAQAETRYAVAESAEVMLKSAEEAGEIISGRVVRVIKGAGPHAAPGATAGKTVRRTEEGVETTLEIADKQADTTFSALVIRADDGTERIVPTTSVGQGSVLLPLDAPGTMRGLVETHDPNVLAKVSEDLTVPQAFSLRAARGAFDPNSMMSTVGRADLDNLQGQHVIFGNQGTVGGMFSATQKQWEHSSELAAMTDNFSFFVKSWQTVFRPAFHITNAAGAYFQARALGVSPMSSTAGMYDAARFMHGDPKLAAVYDKMALHLSGTDGLTGVIRKRVKGIPTMEFLRVIRRAGREGIEGTPDAEVLAKFGLQPEDLVFRAGGQDHNIGELLDVMAREGLFSTFINDGLRGSSSTTEALFRLRAGVMDRKLLSAKLGDSSGVINQAIGTGAEASEAFARLGVTFAQLREGVSLEHAVRNAKRATVDYAQITPTERMFKRGVLYYTFPRHYLPFAAKHMAEDPSALARMSTFMKASTTSGVGTEENGRLVMRIPGSSLGLDATRINPNLEAVKMLEAVGEVMLNTGDVASELVTGRGHAVAREERYSGQTDIPFEFGTPARMIGSAFGIGNTHFLEEAANAFWITRLAFAEDDPLGEKTLMTQLADSVLLGTKHSRPKHMRNVILGRYRNQIGELRTKMRETKDPEYREALSAEMRRLNLIMREKYENVRGADR